MSSHVVICVLSTFTFAKSTMEDNLPMLNAPEEYEYKLNSFASTSYSADSKLTLLGQQTNEAPVSCLIQLAEILTPGNPVTRVVYLCSEKARNDVEYFDVKTGMVRSESPERHFIETVRKNCLSQLSDFKNEDFFVRVDFNERHPARSLDALIAALGEDALVDIDTTGGFRDAIFLLANAVHVIKMESYIERNAGLGRNLGTVLYSHKLDIGGRIVEQKDTFDLIDLVNAVNAFTRYGKAEQLVEHFRDPRSSTTMKALCENMQEFSDSLALCRTDDIASKVMSISTCLENTLLEHEESEKQYTNYALASDCLDLLEAGASFADVKAFIGEAIEDNAGKWQSIQRSEWFQVEGSVTLQKLVTALKKREAKYSIWRSELLFGALVPSIQKSFIDTGNSRNLIIEIIRWCLDRQMIVQALALFRERLPQILLDRKYIELGSNRDLASKSLADRVASLVIINRRTHKNEAMAHFVDYLKADNSSINLEEQCMLSCCKPKVFSNEAMIRVTDEGEKFLPAILVWYRYALRVRNEVMHVGDDEGSSAIIRTTELFFGNHLFSFNGTTSAIGIIEDLQHALDEFESPRKFDDLLKDIPDRSPCKRHLKQLRDYMNEKRTGRTEVQISGYSSTTRPDCTSDASGGGDTTEPTSTKWLADAARRIDDAAAKNPNRLLTWEMIFPEDSDLPEEERSRPKNQIIGTICSSSKRYKLVRTLEVDSEQHPNGGSRDDKDREIANCILDMTKELNRNCITEEDIQNCGYFDIAPGDIIKRMARMKPQIRKGTSYIRVIPDNSGTDAP